MRPHHRFHPVRTCVLLAFALASAATACGDSSDATEATPVSETPVATTDRTPTDSSATATTAAPTTATETATTTTTTTTTTEPVVTAEWDGGDFVTLVDARMDEIAAVFGQPATAESVAPLFEIPSDFPYPQGTIVGAFRAFDRDIRIIDEARISDERIVGVEAPDDGTAFATTFDAISDALPPEGPSRWSRSSSQRDAFVNDLFTADALDGSGTTDRLLLSSDVERQPGQPALSFAFEVAAAAIPAPTWLEGLPVLDGGELITLREGRGLVEDFGTLANDGFVELRLLYPLERFDELEALFESGVIAAAGFEYEDTPFSNFDIRIDVSVDDWEGTVGVGTANVNNEDVGYELIWRLTRPA